MSGVKFLSLNVENVCLLKSLWKEIDLGDFADKQL